MADDIRVRVGADGQSRFTARVRLRGAPAQSKTHGNITEARKWIASVKSSIREGRFTPQGEAQRHTLHEAIERYRAEVMPHKAKWTKAGQAGQLTWWDNVIGDRRLSDVTAPLIVECRTRLLTEEVRGGKTRKGSSVNRHLAVLSHLLVTARKEWGWVSSNPLADVSKMRESQGRVRCLNADERKALLRECRASQNPALYDVVILALSTGMRKSEILNMTWDDVDLDKGLIVLHKTKNRHRRGVTLAGLALELLKARSKFRRIDTKFIFASPTANRPVDTDSAWYWALERSGVQDMRFHDLRHCAASYLAEHGATLAEIASTLGHRTLQMVARYSHLTNENTAPTVAKMNAALFGAENEAEHG